MLNRRLIPKLQLKARKFGTVERMVLVTTVGFERFIEIGDPISQAKIYEAQAADELIFLDLDATHHKRQTIYAVIEDAAQQIFMPITVGGGVCSIEDFRELLRHGADKVAINSSPVENPSLINDAAEQFGTQCVVLSIDYRKSAEGYFVWTHGAKVRTRLDPIAWALEGERRGAGEILLTSIDRDGTRSGLDIELTRRAAQELSVPVITSGGCGIAKHFVEGFVEGKADAVAAGTYFCFRDQNPMQTRAHIRNAGVPIRLLT